MHSFPASRRHDCVKLLAVKEPEISRADNDPNIMKAIEKTTGIFGASPWRTSPPSIEFYETIDRMVYSLRHLSAISKLLPKRLPELLADASISALVGSNDYIAILAHEFLRREGVSIPGKLSICGFDNDNMAMNDDLISYDFFFGNIAADVLAYIINPSAEAFKTNREIECRGAIMQRSTTGPAPKT